MSLKELQELVRRREAKAQPDSQIWQNLYQEKFYNKIDSIEEQKQLFDYV